VFGPHLTLDCNGCPANLLSDVSLISKTLDSFPAQLGMTKIMPPYVFEYHGSVPEDWGVSGIVMISESHLAIHSFVEKGFVTLDIFSCKDFDVDEAISTFCKIFKPKSYEKNLLMRGYHFPRTTKELVDREREKISLH